MQLIIGFVSCIVAAIVSLVIFNYKSVIGDMDVSWNKEKQCWDATLHYPSNTDFSRKKKLILKIHSK